MKSALPAIGLLIPIIAALLITSPVVHADEPVTSIPVAPTLEEKKVWYGWQTLIVDGTSMLLVPLISIGVKQPIGHIVAANGYIWGGPIVHGVHGHTGTFVASLALRAGFGLAGMYIGNEAERCDPEAVCYKGAIIGSVLGGLTAVILDVSYLAYDTVPVDTGVARTPHKTTAITWYPTGGPRKEGGFTLGLGGTF